MGHIRFSELQKEDRQSLLFRILTKSLSGEIVKEVDNEILKNLTGKK